MSGGSNAPARTVIVGLPQWGLNGPCVFAERLVRGLRGRGFDASVLLTEQDCAWVPPPPDVPRPSDLPVRTLAARRDDPWGVRWEALVRALEEAAPCHYLMLHDWRNNVVAPRLSNRVRLTSLLQADHELDFEQAGRLGRWLNAVVAVADPLQFAFAHRFPHLAHRARTIRNVVPSLPHPPAKPSGGPLRLGWSGELRRTQKRLDDLLRIAALLEARGVDFELVIWGDGECRDELVARRDAAGLGRRVRFAGRIPASEVPDAMADRHAFVMTSSFEGLSISLLEAMSRACVPVVTRLATQSLLLRDGVNALTVPVGDVEGFADRLARLAADPELRARLGRAAFDSIAEGGHRLEDMLDAYETHFASLDAEVDSGAWARPEGLLHPPPARIGGIDLMVPPPGRDEHWLHEDARYANGVPRWPDAPPPLEARSPASGDASPVDLPPLEDWRVIVSATGQISGVDTFSVHLLRHLRAMGIDGRVHGHRTLDHRMGLALADDLPVDAREDASWMSWPLRWRKAIDHVESLGPAIYVPNYDYDYSCIAPRLSDRIRVVTICHSDDPAHYEHVVRLAPASDAIVCVSTAIAGQLRRLVPGVDDRLHVIPYGIARRPRRPATGVLPAPEGTLRIAFVGRLMLHQKRCHDLVPIAEALERRGVPFQLLVVGDGLERDLVEKAARGLLGRCRIAFLGGQPNEAVQDILATCHALLLPSSFEGLSVGMLEAMAAGVVPVVSAIRSGVPDAIRHGENGLVAPIGDVEAFADLLAGLHADRAALARLSAAAARTIETGGYLAEHMAARYVELFRTLIAAPTRRSPGAIVPPAHLRREGTVSQWAERVAADPLASIRRVASRFARGR